MRLDPIDTATRLTELETILDRLKEYL